MGETVEYRYNLHVYDGLIARPHTWIRPVGHQVFL